MKEETDTPKGKKRIHYVNWVNSQLSIAKHYGGLKLDGVDYVVDKESCQECIEHLKKTGEYKELPDKYFPDLIEA